MFRFIYLKIRYKKSSKFLGSHSIYLIKPNAYENKPDSANPINQNLFIRWLTVTKRIQ